MSSSKRTVAKRKISASTNSVIAAQNYIKDFAKLGFEERYDYNNIICSIMYILDTVESLLNNLEANI